MRIGRGAAVRVGRSRIQLKLGTETFKHDPEAVERATKTLARILVELDKQEKDKDKRAEAV